MNTSERADIIALGQLEAAWDIEKLPYNSLVQWMSSFIDDVLLADAALATSAIRQQVARQYMDAAKRFRQQQLSMQQLEECRVQAWEQYDTCTGAQQHLVRAAICCLYDEETAGYGTYGAGAILETFLAILFDLDQQYCARFAAYVIHKVNTGTGKQ